MPICLEPGVELTVSLASDEHKPLESRPVFVVKAQSARQTRRLGSLLDQLAEKANCESLHDEAITELQNVVVGWRNIPVEFSKDAMWDVLHIQEVIEILRRTLWTSRVDADEKKS